MQADITNMEQKYIATLIAPLNKDILEIGCGYGEQISYLSRYAKTYFAVDSNDNAISFLNKQYSNDNKLKFFICKADNLPFENESFDAVISFMCFHEIPENEQEESILEMIRVLRKDGSVFLMDPAFPSSEFQNIFDIAHEVIFCFDHKLAVKKSKEFLTTRKDIIQTKIKEYKTKYRFENLEDLTEYVYNSFSDEANLNTIQKQEISKRIKEYLDSKAINSTIPFILEDIVSVHIVQPAS